MKAKIDPQKSAVIVVDLQGDFTEAKHGSLAVPGTDQAYIRTLAKAVNYLREKGILIVFTQDWHPQDHISFAQTHGRLAQLSPELLSLRRTSDGQVYQQELWPVHCVQGTENAKILIPVTKRDLVQKKGQRREYDSYSGFKDAGNLATGLGQSLLERGIETLIIFGLATDFCVQFTALDGKAEGFHVLFIEDLSRGIRPELGLRAMAAQGVEILATLAQLPIAAYPS